MVGVELPRGWRVIKEASRSKTATGGHFSAGYIAENDDGRLGFMKAMDYSGAFALGVDTAGMLNVITSAYLFERQVCEKCSSSRMKRVVHAIDSFEVIANVKDPYSKVVCLIFERADGDIRAHLDASKAFDVAFILRLLHQVTTGLEQMHRSDIAHQDLKPSNVLMFSDNAGAKVADLGRAWSKEHAAPHDDLGVAGDMGYAPPELLYNDVPAANTARRFGCDAYLLGSLVVFMFARVHATSLIVKNLDPAHRPGFWGGSYRDVLAYVQSAFSETIVEFEAEVPEDYRSELGRMVKELCDPDPLRRGHPKNGRNPAGQFCLDRYVSEFDLLARKAEIRMTAGKP